MEELFLLIVLSTGVAILLAAAVMVGSTRI